MRTDPFEKIAHKVELECVPSEIMLHDCELKCMYVFQEIIKYNQTRLN